MTDINGMYICCSSYLVPAESVGTQLLIYWLLMRQRHLAIKFYNG